MLHDQVSRLTWPAFLDGHSLIEGLCFKNCSLQELSHASDVINGVWMGWFFVFFGGSMMQDREMST